ncbi:extensin-like [Dioscorea cayenensis subsp. rotundata]|uniref:Extensin-like n=1 Tax=Dioscorea cayennensis subsp. rotundata TaxID=55577 RepID=A0AB40AKM1_DIOCR|nr:extensin-like [Dioscorea cayenensis subsp. rotundata]
MALECNSLSMVDRKDMGSPRILPVNMLQEISKLSISVNLDNTRFPSPAIFSGHLSGHLSGQSFLLPSFLTPFPFFPHSINTKIPLLRLTRTATTATPLTPLAPPDIRPLLPRPFLPTHLPDPSPGPSASPPPTCRLTARPTPSDLAPTPDSALTLSLRTSDPPGPRTLPDPPARPTTRLTLPATRRRTPANSGPAPTRNLRRPAPPTRPHTRPAWPGPLGPTSLGPAAPRGPSLSPSPGPTAVAGKIKIISPALHFPFP